MRQHPDRYRARVQVMLYRGPVYIRSLAFQAPHIPQEGLIDAWLEAFVVRLREAVKTWTTEPSSPS